MASVSNDGKNTRNAEHRIAVAELRSQLATLKCDLQHYTRSHSSPLLTDSIRERIRQVESQLAGAVTGPSRPVAEPAGSDGPATYVISPRYAPRRRMG